MNKAKTYFLSLRPQFFPAVIIPVLAGTAAAAGTSFSLPVLILTILAVTAYHAGMNVLNDYFDYLGGTDNVNAKALTPFTGGSRFIQNGLISPKETLVLGISLIAAGSLIGIWLALTQSLWLLAIGGAGLVTGFFYSAPPLSLAGRGLGEITVGLNFGILVVTGAFVAQTGGLTIAPVAASIPIACLISTLLLVNEFPDHDADRATGKRTLVVRLGPEKARYLVVAAAVAAYASIILGIIIGALPTEAFIALFPAVIMVRGLGIFLRNYDRGPALIPAIKSVITTHALTGLLLAASFLI